MAEIFNLGTLCRCCHADGCFKSLQLSYSYEGQMEVYSSMLEDTLGVVINPPPFDASYTICNECISRLRDASYFKQQVLSCETKFEEYCKNEQALSVKEEILYSSDENDSDETSFKGCSDTEDKDEKRDFGLQIENINGLKNDHKCEKEIKSEDELKVEKSENIEIDSKNVKGPKKNITKAIGSKAKANKTSVKKKTQLELEIHKKSPTGTLYICKVCGESFEIVTKLRRHIMEQHTGSHKCCYCARVFNTQDQFLSHAKKHRRERHEKCPHCPKSFLSKRDLKEHLNTHTRENLFTCNICQKDFMYKQTLRKHILWHNGLNKKCICDICGCSFNDKTNMNIHIRTVHEKMRPFSCSMCPKTFTAKKHLTVHFRNHTGERPFQCDDCPKAFTCLEGLKRHKLKHELQKTGLGSYQCKMCQRYFETRGRFVSHLRTHIGQKDHKCDICGKDFTSKYSLNRHIGQHKGIKPYRCDECNQDFSQKTQLVRHNYRRHDPARAEKEGRLGEKTRCELCFRQVHNIDKHKLIHLKRPHSCEYCGKCYPERNTLNRHIKIVHIGDKPHKCDLCEKKYVKIESLRRHTVKVHKTTLKKEVEET